MAKIIVLAWILKGKIATFPEIFLPFLPVFDTLAERVLPPSVFKLLLQALFSIFAVLLFLNRKVRLSCLALGGIILLAILASQIAYRNADFYCACLLLLAGLQEPGKKPWLLYLQIAIVYFGAGLNKLLDPDWQSGQYFDFVIQHLPQNPFPSLFLAKVMCWATIVTELGLSVGFLVPRWRIWAIWVGIIFHFPSMIIFRTDFGMFIVAIFASYLVFFDWPESIGIYAGQGFKEFLRRIDFDGLFKISGTESEGALRLEIHGRIYSGFSAAKRALLCLPVTHLAMAATISLVRGDARTVVIFLLILFFSPLTDFFFGRRHAG